MPHSPPKPRKYLSGLARGLGLSLGLGFGLGGCVTGPGFDQQLQSWIGQDVDALVSRWGAPSRQFERADGSRVIGYDLDWEQLQPLPMPAYSAAPPYYYSFAGWPYGSRVGGPGTYYHVTRTCRADFMVGKERRIESWSNDGACLTRDDRWNPAAPRPTATRP